MTDEGERRRNEEERRRRNGHVRYTFLTLHRPFIAASISALDGTVHLDNNYAPAKLD